MKDFAGSVPLGKEGKKQLTEIVERNSVLRRKLQSVLRRPHVASLTTKSLKKSMKDHALDVDQIMPNNKLIVNVTNAKLILDMLNEDLWGGYFSTEKWSSSRKARR